MNKVILAEKQFLEPLKEFEKKQQQLVKDHPFIKVTDNTSFEIAKKSRTALVKGRTELQGQQKTINSKVNSIKDLVKEETNRLIEITVPAEEKQQAEVKAYESKQEEERKIREKIKQEREDEIKGMIDEICIGFSDEIELLEFKNIEDFKIQFKNDVERIDTSAFEELEMYFSGKIAVIKNEISSKITELESEQELLISQAENRFQAFKSEWMERFMDASRINIKQLNIDFDTIVPSIDADSFFTFKDQFIEQSGKFRDKLIDLTNTFKLEQEKVDNVETERLKQEKIDNIIQQGKDLIDKWFNNNVGIINEIIFNTITLCSDSLGKSIDEIKSRNFYESFSEIIDLKVEKLERLHKDKCEQLSSDKIKFDESEKVRLKEEKDKIAKDKLKAKKATATEKARQKKLKPFKDEALGMISCHRFSKVVDNKEIQEIINEFIDKTTELKETYTNQINNL